MAARKTATPTEHSDRQAAECKGHAPAQRQPDHIGGPRTQRDADCAAALGSIQGLTVRRRLKKALTG